MNKCRGENLPKIVALFLVLAAPSAGEAAGAEDAPRGDNLFRRDNLVAWCIVPFDARKRGPEERAAMLQRLGFKHFAYDYRAEHVPTFEAEIEACMRHGISLDAWWFPGSLNDEARHILDLCKKYDIRPTLWISGGRTPTASPQEQRERVEHEAERIRPIAEAAAAQGMKVGLYNHGGWFGEPENQLAIIEALDLPNVGIVYNLHHGHDHVDRLGQILKSCQPHLLAVNLNGMNRGGDRRGQKILQLGQGELDLALVRIIRDSGYRGPIGILGHTQDDAEARLQDNLDGLDWLLPQLDGKPAGPKPAMRTPVPQPSTATSRSDANAPGLASGYVAAGRDDYRSPPLVVEVRATLAGKSGYNILVACDTKASAAHWELFSMTGSGLFTAYLPGMQPDHVRTTVDICDGKPHDLAMRYEPNRVRLYVDGKLAVEQAVESKNAAAKLGAPEGLAIGRLVEGTIGCNGEIEQVKILRGIKSDAADAKETVIGLWRPGKADAPEATDESPFKNSAKRGVVQSPARATLTPAPGVHLKAADETVAVSLIDRSANDVYMGVKVDRDGNVFVGGREAVFVFDLQPDGRYGRRREMLRFPTDSIIMGLEFRDDDLWVLASNALYVVPEGRVRREGLQPQRLLWGLPLDLHVSFHCLAWGPEGDLYLTHGDPLLQYGDWTRPDHWGHWTYFSRSTRATGAAAEWLKTPYTGQGAVLRYDPDDGSVQVVATGLRGPVGLAFDRHGNLFTNDNDHESRADQYAPAKLLHVVEGIDFGWPRGWMASKSPDRFDLVDAVCDLGRGVPCDLLFYGDSHLPAAYRERLLMCRWDRHAVTAYRPAPRGATFAAVEESLLVGDDNCRPVGIATGRRGRLFVTCLYMTGNMAAPYCASDLVMVESAKPQPAGDANPAAAITGRAVQSAGDATSADPYLRQLGVRRLSESASIEQLRAMAADESEPTRLAAVLAAGRMLTVPKTDAAPPDGLTLSYPNESSFFKRSQRFHGDDESIDLADFGPVGSFTTAQWWNASSHTAEQLGLSRVLESALGDPSERVQLQAAYFLSLLKDPRTESQIENVRSAIQLRRLRAATRSTLDTVWVVGPFVDYDALRAKPHGPETGNLDLSASYAGLGWRKSEVARLSATGPTEDRYRSMYAYFRIDSGARQAALIEVTGQETIACWLNGIKTAALSNARGIWIVDLQPGGNDVLLRIAADAENPASPNHAISVLAPGQIALTLPEALDSATLAARLREAAAGGATQSVAAEFLSVDWSRGAAEGDAAEGRRLFGVLGCAKCHAVAADQKVAGAPSLFEAKRRFTVPHLVESVLLPSRQVAEPFRAESLVLDDGRTLLGLIVSENAESLELLLPDATRRNVSKSAIEERSRTTLSPMPQGLVKTPEELRNILAYLQSDRLLPP